MSLNMTSPEQVHLALRTAERLVAVQYELVPFMTRLYPPLELSFQPLPSPMLETIMSSADFSLPEIGIPTLVNIASGNEEAGLMLLRTEDAAFYLMAPSRD